MNHSGVEILSLALGSLVELIRQVLSLCEYILAFVFELSERFETWIFDDGIGLKKTDSIRDRRDVYKAEDVVRGLLVESVGRRDGRSIECQLERRLVTLLLAVRVEIGFGCRCAHCCICGRSRCCSSSCCGCCAAAAALNCARVEQLGWIVA